MKSNIPSISIVICTYTEDRWEDLVAALRSVDRQTVCPLETIIVVDHNPALLQRVETQYPGLKVIANHEHRGAAGSRNSAIGIACGDVIAFLDDDVIADSDWLERLREAYQDQNVVSVGGAIGPHWINGRPRWFPEEFDWVAGCTYEGMPTSAQPVRNVILANMSCRRSVFHAVGGFQTDLGPRGTRLKICCEDTELCIRIRQELPGSIVLYEPAARVEHQLPPLRGRVSYFILRCYSEGIAKSLVRTSIGTKDGLSSELSYTTRILPLAVVRNLKEALTLHDLYGLARAGAIVAGLLVTALGFVIGMTTESVVRSGLDRASGRARIGDVAN